MVQSKSGNSASRMMVQTNARQVSDAPALGRFGNSRELDGGRDSLAGLSGVIQGFRVAGGKGGSAGKNRVSVRKHLAVSMGGFAQVRRCFLLCVAFACCPNLSAFLHGPIPSKSA